MRGFFSLFPDWSRVSLTGAASAATVLYELNSSAVVGASSQQDLVRDFDDAESDGFVPLPANAAVSVKSEGQRQSGQSTSSAGFDIDQQSGAIKFGATADVTSPGGFISSTASSGVSFTLNEVLSITGTGDITFRLAVEGSLFSSSTANNGGEGSSFEAGMRFIDNSSGFDVLGSDRVFQSAPVNTASVVDELLEFTVSISESKDYLLILRFSANTRITEGGLGDSGRSSADFFNTAFLSFTADPTLSVAPSDPLFLSGTGPVPAVPLPAGLWLMLGALGGLGLLRKT